MEGSSLLRFGLFQSTLQQSWSFPRSFLYETRVCNGNRRKQPIGESCGWDEERTNENVHFVKSVSITVSLRWACVHRSDQFLDISYRACFALCGARKKPTRFLVRRSVSSSLIIAVNFSCGIEIAMTVQ